MKRGKRRKYYVEGYLERDYMERDHRGVAVCVSKGG
jgi:hypothetical protein